MSKLTNCVLFVTLLFLAGGCTSTKFVSTTSTTYPPYVGVVKVFNSTPQGVKYQELGMITWFGTGPWFDYSDMLTKFQRKAAAIGANAIILSPSTATAVGAVRVPRKDAMATAIRISD
jgi:hypothetical protein